MHWFGNIFIKDHTNFCVLNFNRLHDKIISGMLQRHLAHFILPVRKSFLFFLIQNSAADASLPKTLKKITCVITFQNSETFVLCYRIHPHLEFFKGVRKTTSHSKTAALFYSNLITSLGLNFLDFLSHCDRAT